MQPALQWGLMLGCVDVGDRRLPACGHPGQRPHLADTQPCLQDVALLACLKPAPGNHLGTANPRLPPTPAMSCCCSSIEASASTLGLSGAAAAWFLNSSWMLFQRLMLMAGA